MLGLRNCFRGVFSMMNVFFGLPPYKVRAMERGQQIQKLGAIEMQQRWTISNSPRFYFEIFFPPYPGREIGSPREKFWHVRVGARALHTIIVDNIDPGRPWCHRPPACLLEATAQITRPSREPTLLLVLLLLLLLFPPPFNVTILGCSAS